MAHVDLIEYILKFQPQRIYIYMKQVAIAGSTIEPLVWIDLYSLGRLTGRCNQRPGRNWRNRNRWFLPGIWSVTLSSYLVCFEFRKSRAGDKIRSNRFKNIDDSSNLSFVSTPRGLSIPPIHFYAGIKMYDRFTCSIFKSRLQVSKNSALNEHQFVQLRQHRYISGCLLGQRKNLPPRFLWRDFEFMAKHLIAVLKNMSADIGGTTRRNTLLQATRVPL